MTRNLVMDLQDADTTMNHPIRDRDNKFTATFDTVLADSDLTTLITGIRVFGTYTIPSAEK